MKPFEVEIFDRQFNFRCNALIDDSDFVYKYDALSPEKNTIKISKDIPVRVTSEEGTTGDGSICTSDYVRIFDGENEYTGVITKIEKDDNYTIITYMDILHLFDHEVYLKVDDVILTYVEDYLYTILGNEFIATDDNSQKIYGLSITKTSQTEGIFDYCYTENMYAIVNLLNDYIAPMFRDFLIAMTAKINISNKSVDVVIGKVDETDITNIEGDIPNVFDSNYVIRQSNNNQNKLELIDTYDNQYDRYKFYLHASDYSFNQINNDRITPVVNDIEEFDSSIITEEAFWRPYDEALDVITRYNSPGAELTTGEKSLLMNAFHELFFIYQLYANSNYNGFWYYDKICTLIRLEASDGRISSDSRLNGKYYGTMAYDYTNDELLQWMPDHQYALIFTIRELHKSASYTIDWDKISYSPEGQEYNWVLTSHGDSFFATFLYEIAQHNYKSSNNAHLKIEIPIYFEMAATYQSGWEPTESGSRAVYSAAPCWSMQATIKHDITTEEIKAAINAYKQSAQYQSDFARYKAEKFSDILTAYANKIFKASKYSNNIEIVVKQDDSMIKPMEMKIGQVVNIIHDGVSYNSILTGKEIKGGLVKLIFGTIRLELTKILNMKGI